MTLIGTPFYMKNITHKLKLITEKKEKINRITVKVLPVSTTKTIFLWTIVLHRVVGRDKICKNVSLRKREEWASLGWLAHLLLSKVVHCH